MRRYGIIIDLIVVIVFVAIGRHTHDHGVSLLGMGRTWWPFAAGCAVGWIFLAARHRSGWTLIDGAVIVVSTVAVGMVLRVLVGQGTAFAFIVVALVFLGASMIGWRAIAARRYRSNESNKSGGDEPTANERSSTS